MENEDRIKALNILFAAAALSFVISLVIYIPLTHFADDERAGMCMLVVSPTLTYIIGRILCFRRYTDETP